MGDIRMYILLGYEILNFSDQDRFQEALLNILNDGYKWQSLTKGLYMIIIKTTEEWKELSDKLLVIGKGFPGSIRFFMSPIIDKRGYNGWMPEEIWEGARALFKED